MRCAGFPGVVPVGWGAESAWSGFVPVLGGCGVPCPQVGEGGAVWYGGAGLCGGLPGEGGGHRVQVWWGGLSPMAGPLAVWGSPARSLGRPPGVFQYVGRAGSMWRGAWGPLGRGVWDWSVAAGGCGRVVLGGVGPPLSGPSGVGSAVYGPRAGYCVCGVRGSVGRGILGAMWPHCGARGW